MAKTNAIKITRVPGKDPGIVTATISVQFDPGDPEAVDRFGRVMRELIPEDERAQFAEDFNAAAAAAGFKSPLGSRT